MALPLIIMVAVFWAQVSMSIFACMGVFPVSSTQVEVLQMAGAPHQAHCSAVCTAEVASFTGLVRDSSQSPWSAAITARGQFVWLSL